MCPENQAGEEIYQKREQNLETTNVLPCSTERQVKDRIRSVVNGHAGLKLPLESIEDSTDLYRAGMTSQASVVLMIALEGEFGVEFPDSMLSRDVFTDVGTIARAIENVQRMNL